MCDILHTYKLFQTVTSRQIYDCFKMFVEFQDSLESPIFSPDAKLTCDVIKGLVVQPEPSPCGEPTT